MTNYEPRSFIYNFDILSGNPGIFTSGYKNFSTVYGLIVATGIIIVDLLYAIYAFYLFLFEREMTIIELNDNFTTKNVTIPSNELLFAFNVFNKSLKFEFIYGKEINLNAAEDYSINSLKNNYTVVLYYVNPENNEIQHKYYLETEFCEIGKNIDQNLIDKYNFTEYKNYLCISRNKNFDIIINQTYTTYIDIIVSLKMENENGFNNQKIFSDDTTYISNYSYLDFQMYTQNDVISNKNKYQPIKYRKYFYNQELVTVGNVDHSELISKYIDYSSDSGVIIKKKQNFNGISVDSFKSKSLSTGSLELGKNMLYYEFRYIISSDSIESYERSYTKLPTILSNITGVFSTLLALGQFLVSFFCKHYLEMYTMTKFFQSKILNESKQKNIIKINEINSRKELNNEIIYDISKIGISSEHSKKSLDKNISLNLVDNPKKQNKNIKKNIDIIHNGSNTNNLFENKIKFLNIKSFNSFEFILYFFCGSKTNKTKIIEKVTHFYESSLSVEEIIERVMILEIMYEVIKAKLGNEYNLEDYFKIKIEKDKELNGILEKEIKKFDN